MQIGDWRGTTRKLWRLFLRELPIMLGIWLVVGVGLGVYGYLQGESIGDALRTALVFLPLAVPLSPVLWLHHEHQARRPSALPAIGLGCLWALVTLPLAVATAVGIANLLGVE